MSQLYSMLLAAIFMHVRMRVTVEGSLGGEQQPRHCGSPLHQVVPSGLLRTVMERLNEGRSSLLTKDGGEGGTGVGDVEAERGTAAALLRRSEQLLWELTHQSPGSSTLRLATRACPAPPRWQGPPACGINRREFAFLNRLLIGEAGRTRVIHTGAKEKRKEKVD